jgi:hypothetical protein
MQTLCLAGSGVSLVLAAWIAQAASVLAAVLDEMEPAAT